MKRSMAAAALLVFGLTAACNDSGLPSAPGDTTVDVRAVDLMPSTSGDNLVCTATMRAVAEGEGAAAWTGGSAELFVRGQVINRVPYTRGDVSDFFGSGRIEAGETQEFESSLTLADTFAVVFEFNYVSGGDARVDSASMSCWEGAL